jgi:two-component system, chemotaxis family, protein-glutamate methylesterase/glutaminase
MLSRVILLGASAGGVSALSKLVAGLPADLPAAVFVVLHIAPYGKSAMPAILSRAGLLPASHPEDQTPIEGGRIYVAPPDHHLILEDGLVRISRGPTENSQRPAVDVLFRTAAQSYGRRAVGVVLTGNLDDGTAGLAIIKRYGGITVAQDPEDADYPSMPTSAIQNVEVDHIAPLADIPALLVALANQPVDDDPVDPPSGTDPEGRDMKQEIEHGQDPEERGVPSDLTCPACGGSLRESRIDSVVHFRCRTGHAFSPETLLAKQADTIEEALWAALRALEENAALARRMERRLRSETGAAAQERYGRRAQDAERHAEVLRRMLVAEDEAAPKEAGASSRARGL